MNSVLRVCVLVLALMLMTGPASAATRLPRDSVYQLDLHLAAQDGTTAPLAARRGRPQLVSMFYTSCTMVCPLIVDTLKVTRQAVDEPARERLDVLVVTFDPAHDDVAALRRFAEARRLRTPLWTFARATPGDTRLLAALLGVQYRQLPDGDFSHSSDLLLLDREGRIVARTSVIGKIDPAFVEAVRKEAAAP